MGLASFCNGKKEAAESAYAQKYPAKKQSFILMK